MADAYAMTAGGELAVVPKAGAAAVLQPTPAQESACLATVKQGIPAAITTIGNTNPTCMAANKKLETALAAGGGGIKAICP